MWEVPGSNLGRATGPPEVYPGLLQFLQASAATGATLHHNRFLPSTFRFIINHCIIRSYFIFDTNRVVK